LPDPEQKAYLSSVGADTWMKAQKACFDEGYFPSSIKGINNTPFETVFDQPFWTGIVRKHTMMRSDQIQQGM